MDHVESLEKLKLKCVVNFRIRERLVRPVTDSCADTHKEEIKDEVDCLILHCMLILQTR